MALTNSSTNRRNRRSRSDDTLADMRQAVREIVYSRGCVTEADLKTEGFTLAEIAEIAEHGEAAVASVRRLQRAGAH